MIDHFITVRYDRSEIDPMPPWLNEPKTVDDHNDVQRLLFEQFADQIARIYPDATLHVITNVARPDHGHVVYHHFEAKANHLIKFQMYGLIDEPAMYMDCDIVIVSPFHGGHTEFACPAGYFTVTRDLIDIQDAASEPLPGDARWPVNAGMVWIGEPSKKIVNDLVSLHGRYFSDPDRVPYEIADEHAATLYWSMAGVDPVRHVPGTNVPRSGLRGAGDILRQQTVHYTGYALANKRRCLSEYPLFSLARRAGRKTFL